MFEVRMKSQVFMETSSPALQQRLSLQLFSSDHVTWHLTSSAPETFILWVKPDVLPLHGGWTLLLRPGAPLQLPQTPAHITSHTEPLCSRGPGRQTQDFTKLSHSELKVKFIVCYWSWFTLFCAFEGTTDISTLNQRMHELNCNNTELGTSNFPVKTSGLTLNIHSL